MRNIVKRPYRYLCDFTKIYNFMIDNYSPDCKNGCMPTYFEYAQVMHWTEKTQNHRYAIWEENNHVVAFCWYNSCIGEAYFNLSEGYEFLISEMINHAETRLAKDDGKLKLIVYGSQTNILDEAIEKGYTINNKWSEGVLDFSENKLDFPLPHGYIFEEPGNFDMGKMISASWTGFDNKGEPDGGVERGYHLWASPNSTPDLDVIIKNEQGEYACYAGMWWVPQIKLAYLEPLCTVPKHREKGLARAALSELYRRTLKLGATHMTGGENKFYFNIGYKPKIEKIILQKNV